MDHTRAMSPRHVEFLAGDWGRRRADRLMHHATVVQITGESYQLKDKRRAGVMTKKEGR
jgi:DNA replication protein DnaC